MMWRTKPKIDFEQANGSDDLVKTKTLTVGNYTWYPLNLTVVKRALTVKSLFKWRI